MTSEWERLESVKKQRLYQVMEYESLELANFEDWLFQNTIAAPDSYVKSQSFSIRRASNLLNRLSLASKEDIIIELVRIKWKKSFYNNQFDKGVEWSRFIKKAPFPYDRSFDAGLTSDGWLTRLALYITKYHIHEINTPEDLEGWGVVPKQRQILFDMIVEESKKRE